MASDVTRETSVLQRIPVESLSDNLAELYRHLVEQVPDGIFVANSDGRYVDVSPAGCEMLGMTREEVLASVLTDLLVPEEHHRLPSEIARFDDGSIVRSVWRMRRKDGSIFDAEIVGRRLPNGNLQGLVRDVTEHRRREEALRESEAQLQSELDDSKLLQIISAEMMQEGDVEALYEKILNAAVSIMRSDYASLQMLYPNRGKGGELRLLAFRGFNPQAAEHWEWVRADSNSTCGLALRTGKRAIAPDVEKCEYMAGEEDQSIYLQAGIHAVQTTPLFSRSGDLVGMISTHWNRPHQPTERDLRLLDIVARQAADLIERNKAENELRESEARFRMLADNMNQLAWTCDKLGDVTWYNQRWLDYTGLSFEEMKDWGWKQVHHPDHVDRVVASVMRSQESGKPWEDTFPLRGKDGRYRWFLSRAVPIHNAAGEIVRWLGTNTDITEQRQAEEVQRLLTSELSHRVKNMLATVQAIASQTLRHSKDPGQFVSSFSGRIQSMSRMHTMLSSSDWQGADLRDVIRDQLLLGPVDESRMTAWGPAVHLDPQMALQVAMMLHELGINSIKYGALSTTDGIVTVGWSISDDTLRLQWAERGGPRVNAPVRRGFGTSLIEQSAKSAGGSAHMSIEDIGVHWEITIPLPRVNGAHERPPPLSETEFVESVSRSKEANTEDGGAPALAGKRFLLIEDEPLVALDLVDSLQQAGAEITGPVGDTAEAIAVIEKAKLDAALLDANLRGCTVGDIAAALTRKNVPFAFVTGYGRESLPPAFSEAIVLSKPFNHRELLGVAVKLVQKRADVRKLRA